MSPQDSRTPTRPSPRGPTPQLSPRELSCLHWAAHGKTSAEIGLILGISTHTVNFHLLNASRRLAVYGRQAAINAAWHAGLLPCHPAGTDQRRPSAAKSRASFPTAPLR